MESGSSILNASGLIYSSIWKGPNRDASNTKISSLMCNIGLALIRVRKNPVPRSLKVLLVSIGHNVNPEYHLLM